LTVQFTNNSTGDFTQNLWHFGDGITSTLPSPSHTYGAAGSYTVTLAINGPGGNDTQTKAEYIVVENHQAFLPIIIRQE
jgi:PKD repeat protein